MRRGTKESKREAEMDFITLENVSRLINSKIYCAYHQVLLYYMYTRAYVFVRYLWNFASIYWMDNINFVWFSFTCFVLGYMLYIMHYYTLVVIIGCVMQYCMFEMENL